MCRREKDLRACLTRPTRKTGAAAPCAILSPDGLKSGGGIMDGNQYSNQGSRPWPPPRGSRIALIVGLTAVLAGMSRIPGDAGGGREWRMIGHDPSDTRSQPFERMIEPGNVSRLAVKWVATTTGDVSATPAVVDGAVYFGDFGGTLWKLNADTGDVIWSHVVSDYTGIPGDLTRTSPSLAGHTVLIGDLSA